jgi:hypothetical protein
MSTKNIKTAQFGGVGGGGNGQSFAPGGSPIGNKGKNSGSWDINIYIDEDASFDKILSRTHLDRNYDSSDNIEKRLTPQHRDSELELNYILSPSERRQKRIWDSFFTYQEALREHAEEIKNKSKDISYTKASHMMTREESLKARRNHDDLSLNRHEREDNSPDTIKPERTHPVLSETELNRVAQYLNNNDDDEIVYTSGNRITKDTQRDPTTKIQKTISPFNYNTPVLTDGAELDNYLENSDKANRGGQYSMYNEPTILDYTNPDYAPTFANPRIKPIKKMVDENKDNIEKRLHTEKFISNTYDRMYEKDSLEEQYNTYPAGTLPHTPFG